MIKIKIHCMIYFWCNIDSHVRSEDMELIIGNMLVKHKFAMLNKKSPPSPNFNFF